MADSSRGGGDNHLRSSLNELYFTVWVGAMMYALAWCGRTAYKIRLHAIEEYGPVIHEFDPYFNYRATEYLHEHGWQKFVKWFDYKSWYPLGRPVGTTIYPGMQVSAVILKGLLGDRMSLNDVCCYMPAWFGVSASFMTGLMAYECSLPSNCVNLLATLLGLPSRKTKSVGSAVEVGIATMAFMAIVPAHLMRSVGGGFDNESVAITAMSLTFWLWCRSLRASDPTSWVYGAVTGVAYFYMAASWGGYVFVLNLIGCHAAVLVLVGRFSTKLYRSYSLFYAVGTALATRVPVVGMTPLKSLEQLGPTAVFLGFQCLRLGERWWTRRKQQQQKTQSSLRDTFKMWIFGLVVFGVAVAFVGGVVYLLLPTGYFGPISARVRGLFVKHTKTGNPLVDSVAEHQPASPDSYYRYIHNLCYGAPVGFGLVATFFLGDAPSFLLVYAIASYYFSQRMVRLVLLLGPIASALGGVVVGRSVAWSLNQWLPFSLYDEEETSSAESSSSVNEESTDCNNNSNSLMVETAKKFQSFSSSTVGNILRRGIAVAIVFGMYKPATEFYDYCWEMSHGLSHPTIVLKGTTQAGETVLVDDYREAYWWVRDNTPEDARVMAWWDYGYQISAIANRTTLADGNTWNHEHIALLGKILTSPEKQGHRIARHLADYVLVWGGGRGDDLAKSPHLARIANSVYRDHCPRDPTCRQFGYIAEGTPSQMMEESLLYKLHSHNLAPGVQVDPNRFKEVYTSPHGKVRVFRIMAVSKESKAWVANPANRDCDAPGSWFCRGRYPPALENVLSQKKDFAQLEDFNSGKEDRDYQKGYFEGLEGRASSSSNEKKKKKKTQKPPASQQELQQQPQQDQWADTEITTLMWELISNNDIDGLDEYLSENPSAAHVRSGDGRGPLFWAYEHRRSRMIKMLTSLGVPNDAKDKYGKYPQDMMAKK